MNSFLGRRSSASPMNVYRCPASSDWHFGHARQAKKRAIKRKRAARLRDVDEMVVAAKLTRFALAKHWETI